MIFGNWLIFNALHFPHCPTLPDGWKIGKWPDLSESQITRIKGFLRLYCPHLPIQTATYHALNSRLPYPVGKPESGNDIWQLADF